MLTRVFGAALLVVGVVGASAPAAHADGATTGCVGRTAITNACSSGTVTVVATQDGQPVGTTLSDGGGTVVCQTTRGVVGGGGPRTIPCNSDAGWWSAEHNCYVKVQDPPLPKTDPIWQGHETGTVYSCTPPAGVAGPPIAFWADSSPVSAAQVRQLAARATESLGLSAIGVGMAPTPTSLDAASIGIVGLPNWMWVENPSAQTWGPATATASDGAVSVTVTAHVDRVTWDMGDGSEAIVCTTAGTPYQASYQAAPSPDCGHNPGYQQQGTYQVSAISHWTITYASNVGISGTLDMDLTSQVGLTVGELQAVVVPARK